MRRSAAGDYTTKVASHPLVSGTKYLGGVEGKRIVEKAKRRHRSGVSGAYDYAGRASIGGRVSVSEDRERSASSASRAPQMLIQREITPQLGRGISVLIEDPKEKAAKAADEEALFGEVRARRVRHVRFV
jgi:hypothetical protein